MAAVLDVEGLSKTFELHQQGGVLLPVLDDLCATVEAGEAVAVTGASGRGKSSLLKLIYGTYRATAGRIGVWHEDRWVDVAVSLPRDILDIRRKTVGYVSQFLRVIPRVPAETIVAEPLTDRGIPADLALERARALLERLTIPKRLWHLSPMTFSGGEQQRVNIARGFAAHFPILLLDEPTASLDLDNRRRVLELIDETRRNGAAVISVFHDETERRRASAREIALG